MDMVIRNARVRGQRRLVDIGIVGEQIRSVEPGISGKGKEEIDAAGRVVIPPFLDTHIHLDYVLTVGQPRQNRTGTLWEGIAIWSERKKAVTYEEAKRRITEAVKWQVANGVGYVRTHVDVTDPNLTSLKAMLDVKQEVRDLIDLEIVAFPQEGILSFPNGEDLMRQAVEMGADLVGAIPHYEHTREYGLRSLDFVFDLARKYGRRIDVHCDEVDDEQSRFIETMAAHTIKYGMQGKVTASHTTAFGSYNGSYIFKLLSLLRQAGVHIVANPTINLTLQGRFDAYPKRRGLTPVKELIEAGINVCCGHDCIMDPWYPLGMGNMVQVAFTLIHAAQMTGSEEMFRALDCVTYHAAKAFQVEDRYGVAPGKQADLVVIDAMDEGEILRRMPVCAYVLKRGRVVAQSTAPLTQVIRGGQAEAVTPGRWPQL